MAKTQPLSYPIRLPDHLQAAALRMLDASRTAINGMLTTLWPQLDAFAPAVERTSPAWKQVEALLVQRPGHGNRQERCEMEQAGRILRAQATRKQVFTTILPLLTADLIRPAEGKRPAVKDYRAIKEQVRALRTDRDDAESFMALTNVIEQACNVYLERGTFPATYEALQPIPVQQVAQVTFAGDDGMSAGQTYRAIVDRISWCDLATQQEHDRAALWLRLRTPDIQGQWAWDSWLHEIPLPETLCAALRQRATTLAPTLRELVDDTGQRLAVVDVILEVPAHLLPPLEQEQRVVGFDWGIRSLITVSVIEQREGAGAYHQISRPVFLNTGGMDGRQARLRREIDRLKACQEKYQTLMTAAVKALDEHHTPLPAHFALWQERVAALKQRIERCWQTYGRRNRELAHLASNVLILLALVHDCHLICGEDLRTLRTVGRGKNVRGRWRNWRKNTTVRGELWRVLKYKCHLLGIRARQEYPEHTSHTCPHCGKPAQTYRSSASTDRTKVVDWGAWLCCAACGWNGSRDYAASLNIARLGMAFLGTYQRTKRYTWYRVTSKEVNSCVYSRQEARLLLPVQGITPRPLEGRRIHYAGWSYSTSLRTSHPQSILAFLSASALRKRVCDSAETSA